MVHKIVKSYTSDLWYVVESDPDGTEKKSTTFETLAKAKKRALERKDVMGERAVISIEQIKYFAK